MSGDLTEMNGAQPVGARTWTAEEIRADFERRAAALSQIEAEVHDCRRCKLASTRTHAVPGEGNRGSVVLFVGEGPGAEEDRQARPFVGKSGQLLTENLARLGIRREEVFITNVVKCRPPDNRDPEPDEIAACADYLSRQIDLINPRIIVTLGRVSMSRFFPGQGITRVHGQVKNIGGGRVALAMFHPAAALRNPAWKTMFEQDIEILPRLIERARKANESALRGEALPAGVPHPGDPDYVVAPADALHAQDGSAPAAAASRIPGQAAHPVSEEGSPDENMTQLSLF